jgi:homoserine dehydrogenase
VIAAEIARRRKVVAVVSAMGRTTDTLLAAARSVTAAPPEAQIGALLATGEEASVALLTLALVGGGVRAAGVTGSRVPVLTRGALNDADPVHVDTGRIHRALQTRDALVFPGFVGVDASGTRSLLGRGGSDLTAIFLGDALEASEIRLIKDVDGIFPQDPRSSDGLAPYAELTWDSVRRVGGGVVQPKAIDYAERRRVRFRVAGPGGAGTWVRAAAAEPTGCRPAPGHACGSAAGR